MPSIYDLKPQFQKFLKPVLELLVKLKITPNQITIFALILSALTGTAIWYLYQQRVVFLLLPLVLFIRMALNALDGMLARDYNQSTKLGEILNEIGDVVADAALYFPLIRLFNDSELMIVLVFKFVFLCILSEFCGVLAKSMTGKRGYEGPMGKSDRAFFIGAFVLVYHFVGTSIKFFPEVAFVLACLLGTLTCWNRLAAILKPTS